MTEQSTGPRFQHDCDSCEYLGQSDERAKRDYDLWYCARCDGGSLIARRSSEGSDYASSPIDILRSNPQWHPALLCALEIFDERYPKP